ncbi:hypothetical protein AJ78_06093 [Emergomyces pasteurianus Ep9510]|uniref:Ribosome biogenesis protein Alb1 n=1 Tax=Emergomyces pasteurianus Ep9510 TaxID=1447872 RepID=A0A1J9PZX7_9EURO|nr:hypothetical protein AJ78_06093 [Emergomyces pasteurianus Ep9510]
MAKTPKLKANTASKSIHSRAAKRAVSPTDTSLFKSLPRLDPTPTVKPHVLSAQHNAGITKKSKSKQMSRAQRRRQEKGLERAELVMDKTEKKIAKSVGRAKVVKDRRSTWDEMNQKALVALGKSRFRDENEDDVELMDGEGESKGMSTRPGTGVTEPSGPAQKAAPVQKFEFEEDGEIT